MTQLLSDVRVIDMTGYIMGPLASRMLGDMGADVIKVEPPTGDTLRTQRPLLADDIGGLFLNLHRNKRSIVLDLKSDEGRATLERLIATADVLMHNLRSPVMARLGFDYDRCRAIKPDIIYCASYGYGAAGPYAAKPAYDDLIQAASGFASLSEEIQGEAAYTPSVIFDKVVGQVTANAILAALYHRARTGEGQAIEVPMLEVAIDFNLVEHIGGYALVPPDGPIGSSRIRTNERRPFATADGYVCILPYSDRNWRDFFVFARRDDLLADDRYTTIATRQDHMATLYAAIREEAPRHTTAEWVAFCEKADIPCMPVTRLEDVLTDPHVEAVELFSEVEHPAGGTYRSIRSPVTFSTSPFLIRHHAPKLGQHTAEILAELDASERLTRSS